MPSLFHPEAASIAPLVPVHTEYVLNETIIGACFLDKFRWFENGDPTHGFVDYVSQHEALANNLTEFDENSFLMRADHWTEEPEHGRASVRIESYETYTDSVIVLDLDHMPVGCGTWPAFWTVTPGEWPLGGEIDIIEGVNGYGDNAATLHTSPGCNVTDNRWMNGEADGHDCAAEEGHAGCGVRFNNATEPASFGSDFNANGGGTYAMQRDNTGIRVWFFPRDRPLPPDLRTAVDQGESTVYPRRWPRPAAEFLNEACDIERHFVPHAIVINLTLCGDWAGGTAFEASGCPGQCLDYVSANPEAFVDAYWDINWLKTFSRK